MQWNVREDGPYVVIPGGREVLITEAVPFIAADGSLVIRIPARDVNVIAPIVPELHYDMTDVVRLVIAVVRGGLTIAQISAVRPNVATAVQTFMTNHGLVAGSAP